MPAPACLYRRPSGIYVVRIAVPHRLRKSVGRTELHTSTGLRDLNAAKIAALSIQLHWRNYFMSLDTDKLRATHPVLAGPGVIPIAEAASLLGLTVTSLLTSMQNVRAELFTYADGWAGWIVPALYDVELDYDDSYLMSSAQRLGEYGPYRGMVRMVDRPGALASLIQGASCKQAVFEAEGGAGLLLDYEQEISVSAVTASKTAIERIRLHLAAHLPLPSEKPVSGPILSPAGPASLPVVVHDQMTARHGDKRFSDLFAIYSKTKTWAPDHTKRMAKEAGLFEELMGNPLLQEIDAEMINRFAAELARLPDDIYQGRRTLCNDHAVSLRDLIARAEETNALRKSEATIKRHMGRLSEVLNYAERQRMIYVNPAKDYKRGGWDKKSAIRDQDERSVFSEDELNLIFSQDWFKTGSGKIAPRTEFTNWRPHHYWLPVLGLLTGGRINELSQLYLDDIRQTVEDGVWYIDFNLDQLDKTESDALDKTLKSVNAIRVVPIHSRIVQLGLIEYVETLRKAGYTRLFPELKRDPVKGYGKPAGSWFNERFLGKKLNIPRDGMKVFHSFRHGFSTALGGFEMSEREIAQLTGHTRGQTESGKRYIKDRSAVQLTSRIESLSFPCLDQVAKFNTAAGLAAIKSAKRRKADQDKS